MRRVGKSITIIMIILLLCSCTTNNNKPEEITTGRTAIIYSILESNGVKVLRESAEQNGYVGMRLKTGDVVSTDEATKIFVRIDNDKNILFGYSTKVSIEELSAGKLSITLLEGEFFFDVENKLSDEEDMEFNISSSTMAIRGTSGALSVVDGQGMFSIYTGAGEIVSKYNGEEVVLQVLPSVKATFNISQDGQSEEEFNLAPITAEDIPSVINDYVKENEEYVAKLDEVGWDTTTEEFAPAEFDPSTLDEEEAKGWHLNEDNEWVFEIEDLTKETKQQDQPVDPPIEDEPQVEPEKPKTTKCKYCGKEYTDSEKNKHSTLPCGHHKCEVATEDQDKHAECPNVIDGVKHYLCQEGHQVCEVCGKCSKQTTIELCDGKYYCPECAPTLCSHCGVWYFDEDAELHETLAECGKHYLCTVTDIYAHAKCENTEDCNGEDCTHYCCDEDHHHCEVEDCENCSVVSVIYICGKCNKYVCIEHCEYDTFCGKYYCFDCADEYGAYCNCCGYHVCEDCINEGKLYVCSQCGDKYCQDCFDIGYIYYDENGDIVCMYCDGGYYPLPA